ncbi:NADPH-dependent F420 reductase [Sphingobium tyrosinilyticum]|uniref:NADPH-dependent F420 reductase n=1 Tax=Sphingobium tyrosinilyticum TaxID=2715436 RepID=A0ABV9EY31_9SPHN
MVKAFNAAPAYTQAKRGKPSGTLGRIALPVAGDDARGKTIAMQLVDDAGFDPVDAGRLADSWRQQPGTPAYCTELTRDELQKALAQADKDMAPQQRETLIKYFFESGATLSHDDVIAKNLAGTAPK